MGVDRAQLGSSHSGTLMQLVSWWLRLESPQRISHSCVWWGM